MLWKKLGFMLVSLDNKKNRINNNEEIAIMWLIYSNDFVLLGHGATRSCLFSTKGLVEKFFFFLNEKIFKNWNKP